MTKETKKKLCETLGKLADNLAASERLIRDLQETIKAEPTKEPKYPLNDTTEELHSRLDELLEELRRRPPMPIPVTYPKYAPDTSPFQPPYEITCCPAKMGVKTGIDIPASNKEINR